LESRITTQFIIQHELRICWTSPPMILVQAVRYSIRSIRVFFHNEEKRLSASKTISNYTKLLFCFCIVKVPNSLIFLSNVNTIYLNCHNLYMSIGFFASDIHFILFYLTTCVVKPVGFNKHTDLLTTMSIMRF